MDLSYIMYDSIDFGSAVGQQTLFQVPQGGDAIHTESFTNSRGSGQFPSGEKFVIKKIGFVVDYNLSDADLIDFMNLSTFEIRVNDTTYFKCPLQCILAYSGYSGYLGQASAASLVAIGPSGVPYQLEIPITINGGDSFKVLVYQGTPLSGASRRFKVILEGILSIR